MIIKLYKLLASSPEGIESVNNYLASNNRNIMGSDDGRKLRGFPLFLTTVRYVVAAVVTVLAVIVVVMVITVALRPQDVQISILRGYVEASDLWQVSSAKTARTAAVSRAAGLTASSETDVYSSSSETEVYSSGYGDISVSVGSRAQVKYDAVASVRLVVSLSALNPSGRADIACDNVSVSILDVPGAPYDFTSTKVITTFPLERFLVDRETAHTVRELWNMTDAKALSYIAKEYGGRISFEAMLEVKATVVSTTTTLVPLKTPPKAVTYYCWPVTIRTYVPSAATDDVTCKTIEEMVYPITIASF